MSRSFYNVAYNYWRNTRFLVFIIVLAAVSWAALQTWMSSGEITNRINAEAAIAEPVLPTVVTLDDVMQKELAKFNAHEAEVSALIIGLQDSSYASINEEESFLSASLYKAFYAYRAYELADKNQLYIDEKLENCIEKMISVSDNKCGKNLQSLLGGQKTTEIFQSRGYQDTNLSGFFPVTSARDVSKLFVDIYDSKHLSAQSQQKLLDLFMMQRINDRIPAKLPSNTQIAHKTGDLRGNSHDAGIVFTKNGPYVFVFMTRNWEETSIRSNSAIADSSKRLYDQIQKAW